MVKRVTFINETAQIGGAELNLIAIIKGLSAAGWDIRLLVPEHGPLLEALNAQKASVDIIPGCPHWPISFYLLRRFKLPNPFTLLLNFVFGIVWTFRLWRYLRDHGTEIVHTNSMVAHIFGGLAARMAGRKVIWHFHNVVESGGSWKIYKAVLMLLACHIPDRIACVSDVVAQPFLSKPSIQRKTLVLWNTVDTNRFTARERSAFTETGCMTIGTAARITPWKGQEVAVQAAHRLKQKGIPFRWRFAGDVALGSLDYAQHLKKLVHDWGLEQNVIFDGWVKDMQAFYNEIDILVHVPRKPEPYGLTIAEAMASGLPVIATPGGAANSLVVPGGGWLIESGSIEEIASILEHLWKHPGELEARSRQACEVARNSFNMEHYLENLQNLYRTLLAD